MAYIGKSPDGTGVRSRFYYTQTSGGGTSVSGSSDDGTTLAFSDGAYVDVYLNGVLLVAGTDYNTSTANTIAGLAALANGDVVEVVVYDIFTVADTVSSLNGGTFSGAVGFSGGITGDVAFDTNTLKVDSSNNRVGIGDATPDDTLTIYGGTAKLRVGSTDSNHVRIGRNTSTGHFEMMRTTSGATDQVFFKAIEANNGNVILQEGGGNVGIGMTPSRPLHVQASSGAASIYVRGRSSDGTATMLLHEDNSGNAQNSITGYTTHLRLDAGTTSDAAHTMQFHVNDSERMRIAFNGGIFMYDMAGSASAMSNVKIDSNNELHKDTSARITKSEIADLHIGLDEVVALTPRKFKRGSNTAFEIGFIADEMASVAPEVVMRGPKSWITNVETDTEEIDISIEYDKLTALLTKAIQELKTDLDAAKARIATLEAGS